MEGKYSKFLTVLLIIIIVGVIGLLGYLVYNLLKDETVDQEAKEFVSSYTNPSKQDSTQSDSLIQQNTNNNNNQSNEIDLNDISISGIGSSGGNSSSEKKKSYKGFSVVGTIEIPKTNISYPVLEQTGKKALEVAVCALYPRDAKLNSKGNVVIIGHNYRNGKFFSNNKKLSNGDKIYITGLDGNKVTYIVYNTFETDENDTSFYNRDTNGAREITLSTCTDDSSARTIILAKAQGD